MQGHHYIMLIVVLIVGYLVGAKYPAMAQKVGL